MSHKSAKRARQLARTPASLYHFCRKQAGEQFYDLASESEANRRFLELFRKCAADAGATVKEVEDATADIAQALRKAPGALKKLTQDP